MIVLYMAAGVSVLFVAWRFVAFELWLRRMARSAGRTDYRLREQIRSGLAQQKHQTKKGQTQRE